MAHWFRNICLAMAFALAAVQIAEAAAMDMSSGAMAAANMVECDDCPDHDGSGVCAVACPMPLPAVGPTAPFPNPLTSAGFAPHQPNVLAGAAGPPEPQPPRLLARG